MINTAMALNEDEASEQLELPSNSNGDPEKLAARRERLLHAVNSSELNTMEEQVAWLLNNYLALRWSFE